MERHNDDSSEATQQFELDDEQVATIEYALVQASEDVDDYEEYRRYDDVLVEITEQKQEPIDSAD